MRSIDKLKAFIITMPTITKIYFPQTIIQSDFGYSWFVKLLQRLTVVHKISPSSFKVKGGILPSWTK